MDTVADKIVAQRAEADRRERLLARFPDLREHTDRWRRMRLCAKSATPLVTDVHIKHNCGCCSDSPLEAWPFLEAEGEKVYADPPCFMVGEKVPYEAFTDRPYEGWDEKMRAAGIPEMVIEKVAKRFPSELGPFVHPEDEE